MPKISVICVTNRSGAVEFLKKQLDKQTFQDFEVIVADDGNNPILYEKQFVPRQKKEGDVWNFQKAHNDCLDKAEGELFVFLQDFIWIPANGLERFWEDYQLYPNDIFTGVGHKAQTGLDGISETDERVFGEPGLAEGNWTQFEINWAATPRFLPKFNEEWDSFYAGGEKLLAKQLEQAGHLTWIDRSNRCLGLSQEECGGRPSDWEEKHFLKSKWIQ